MASAGIVTAQLPVFDRHFWDGKFRFTQIGTEALGGKASGLAFVKDLLRDVLQGELFQRLTIDVPVMAVIATDFFDKFIAQNHLADLPFDEMTDQRIGDAFQKTDLPVDLLGDLRALIQQVTTPLAVRSSSLLEDSLQRPFAGVYATKMIPNNQFDADTRFRRLTEAIKFVYASTFFREARDYMTTTGRSYRDEKMAVILQEVVGQRHGDRFYPEISGVARSYNFYSLAPASPRDGVVSLALGLGKIIVDGGTSWTYSPAFPKNPPPFSSVHGILDHTQNEFWAVNMGKPPVYDPVNEVEYMTLGSLRHADNDQVLRYIASTFDPSSERVVPGLNVRGPRVVDFAPLLVREEFPLNEAVKAVLAASEKATGANVEIEFAATVHHEKGELPRMRLGFLQVRPMVVSEDVVDVGSDDLNAPDAVVASETVIGNGVEVVHDVVYVRPEKFSILKTPQMAAEVGTINRRLRDAGVPYVLIGFGRWGSSHASLGIPVDWAQICGARAIVESTLPQMDVDLSQGSHFFHNLSSFQASYFMVRHDSRHAIRWDWLEVQPAVEETEFVRHVRTSAPLTIRVDGRTSRGVIAASPAEKAVAE
jgi:Pyruvate phosphate dikinase, AMP/ATP-binding domain